MLHTQKKTLKDKISYLFKKNNNNGHNFDIDLNTIYLNYEKIFNTWSNLKKGNNFNLYFFLQPFPNWFNKNLSNEELELFNLLDNSNLEAHRILKKISNLNFYKNFLNILKETTKNSSINFVNLNDKILGSDKSREWLFVDRVHMTDLGYSVLTKIILDNIK